MWQVMNRSYESDYEWLRLAQCPMCQTHFELTAEREKMIMIEKEDQPDGGGDE